MLQIKMSQSLKKGTKLNTWPNWPKKIAPKCTEHMLEISTMCVHYGVLAKKNAPFPNFDFLAILPSNKGRSIVRTLKKSFFSVLWPPNLSH